MLHHAIQRCSVDLDETVTYSRDALRSHTVLKLEVSCSLQYLILKSLSGHLTLQNGAISYNVISTHVTIKLGESSKAMMANKRHVCDLKKWNTTHIT